MFVFQSQLLWFALESTPPDYSLGCRVAPGCLAAAVHALAQGVKWPGRNEAESVQLSALCYAEPGSAPIHTWSTAVVRTKAGRGGSGLYINLTVGEGYQEGWGTSEEGRASRPQSWMIHTFSACSLVGRNDRDRGTGTFIPWFLKACIWALIFLLGNILWKSISKSKVQLRIQLKIKSLNYIHIPSKCNKCNFESHLE